MDKGYSGQVQGMRQHKPTESVEINDYVLAPVWLVV